MINCKTILSAAMLSAIPPSVAYTQPDTSITVTAKHSAVSEWSKRVGNKLSQNLEYPRTVTLNEPDSGIVRVRFVCDPSGTPSQIVLKSSSGSRHLDEAGLRAVTRINNLGPLPTAFASDQKFEAALLFSTDEASHDRQLRILKAEAVERNRWLAQHPAEAAAAAYQLAAAN